jgi:hypothetical protein
MDHPTPYAIRDLSAIVECGIVLTLLHAISVVSIVGCRAKFDMGKCINVGD